MDSLFKRGVNKLSSWLDVWGLGMRTIAFIGVLLFLCGGIVVLPAYFVVQAFGIDPNQGLVIDGSMLVGAFVLGPYALAGQADAVAKLLKGYGAT